MATVEMAMYCFDVIIANLRKEQEPFVNNTIPDQQFPLFVTWKKGRSHRLRGCIGTFAHPHLHQGLRDFAMSSAFRDTRFDPIRLDEVPELHCGVSLLVNFESARDYRDWVVGVHGIRINYSDGKHKRDAVYLPEVAYEQGWNHVETLDNLIQKGGFRGHIDENFRRSVQVTRFQSSKVVISYADYTAMKQRE